LQVGVNVEEASLNEGPQGGVRKGKRKVFEKMFPWDPVDKIGGHRK